MNRALINDLVLTGIGTVALVIVLMLVFSDLGTAASTSGLTEIGRAGDVLNAARRRVDGTLVWNALSADDAVFDGDAVYVGLESGATIRLRDGSVLEIDENSLVIVRETVEIAKGSARGSSSDTSPMLVRGAGGDIRLDAGSQARVVVGEDGSSRIDVTRGTAKVNEVDVAEGTSRVTASDGTASVRKMDLYLADPPDRAKMFYTRKGVSVRFSWEEPPDSRGNYVFQIADDPGFKAIRENNTTNGLSATVEGLNAGVYYWRVRRGDRHSEQRRLSVVADTPPVLYRPRPGSEVAPQADAVFAWTNVDGVRNWVLEVQKSVGARQSTSRSITGRTWINEAGLDPGAYCARVRADEAERGASPWSARRCFTVMSKARLRPPTLFDPTMEDDDSEEEATQ